MMTQQLKESLRGGSRKWFLHNNSSAALALGALGVGALLLFVGGLFAYMRITAHPLFPNIPTASESGLPGFDISTYVEQQA